MDIAGFSELVAARRSCRDYLDKPVPDEAIAQCLEAARLAPSACNKQPWRFVIVKSPETRRLIKDRCLLPGLPMPWVAGAPVIAVLCAEESLLVHKIAPMVSGVRYAAIDIGIAGEHFVLAAQARGLGTCWIGWFRPNAVRAVLGIPRGVKPLSLFTLGYPASEAAPSSRLPLDQIAYAERWGGA